MSKRAPPSSGDSVLLVDGALLFGLLLRLEAVDFFPALTGSVLLFSTATGWDVDVVSGTEAAGCSLVALAVFSGDGETVFAVVVSVGFAVFAALARFVFAGVLRFPVFFGLATGSEFTGGAAAVATGVGAGVGAAATSRGSSMRAPTEETRPPLRALLFDSPALASGARSAFASCTPPGTGSNEPLNLME